MSKYITIDSEFCGKIGEKVPRHLHSKDYDLYVGDLVAFIHEGEVYCRPIISFRNKFGIYGFGADNLKFSEFKKIANHHNLTLDLLVTSYHENFIHNKFDIVEPRKMKLEDIEKELGYKIELIK